jgi:hypothetical protein
MNIEIAKERIKEHAINKAVQYNRFEDWFEVEIDKPDLFCKANVIVHAIEIPGFGLHEDIVEYHVMIENLVYEPILKSADEILRECMSEKYVDSTRYHYLDPEEIVMILKAMEIYKNQ